MKWKKITLLALSMFLLQGIRMVFKTLIFLCVNRTLLADAIVSSAFMLIISIVLLLIAKHRKKQISILPEKHRNAYIFFSVSVFLLFFIKSVMAGNESFYAVCTLLYNAIFTVIMEELLFRGYFWAELADGAKSDRQVYFVTSILFGFWHLGYIDTILWRTAMFHADADIGIIMIWKVITGLVFGAILGFFRYRNKNVSAPILLHSFLNLIGG